MVKGRKPEEPTPDLSPPLLHPRPRPLCPTHLRPARQARTPGSGQAREEMRGQGDRRWKAPLLPTSATAGLSPSEHESMKSARTSKTSDWSRASICLLT